MRALWVRKRATVGEIIAEMGAHPAPAYNTVLTIVGILHRKGYVTREREGRAHAYLPVIDRSEARRTALSQLLSRFFDNSPRELVVDLLGHERISPEELLRVRELIEEAAHTEDRSRRQPRRRRE